MHAFVCVCSDVFTSLCIVSKVLILQVGIVYVTVSSGSGSEASEGLRILKKQRKRETIEIEPKGTRLKEDQTR